METFPCKWLGLSFVIFIDLWGFSYKQYKFNFRNYIGYHSPLVSILKYPEFKRKFFQKIFFVHNKLVLKLKKNNSSNRLQIMWTYRGMCLGFFYCRWYSIWIMNFALHISIAIYVSILPGKYWGKKKLENGSQIHSEVLK